MVLLVSSQLAPSHPLHFWRIWSSVWSSSQQGQVGDCTFCVFSEYCVCSVYCATSVVWQLSCCSSPGEILVGVCLLIWLCNSLDDGDFFVRNGDVWLQMFFCNCNFIPTLLKMCSLKAVNFILSPLHGLYLVSLITVCQK